LENRNRSFRKPFGKAPLAITIVRATDGRYVEVNETFELQTGWKRDEVIGRSPLDVSLWGRYRSGKIGFYRAHAGNRLPHFGVEC
jgi:PAS domain S-box-containing protein